MKPVRSVETLINCLTDLCCSLPDSQCQTLIRTEFDFDGAGTPDWPSPPVNFPSALSNELAIIANLTAGNKLRTTSHVIETEQKRAGRGDINNNNLQVPLAM